MTGGAGRGILRSMNTALLTLVALLAGAALAAQATANARLGVLLRSPLAATGFAFFASLVVTLVALTSARRPLPGAALAADVPIYLWFVGGLLSAFGVGAFYWLIPQLGVARVVGIGLVGQLAFSSVASHLGWFGLPVVSMDATRLAGLGCLVLGIALVLRSSP